MLKEYDFSHGVRNRYSARLRTQRHTSSATSQREDPPPLTSTQIRRIRRELADLRDRTRYLIVSSLSTRFNLYYQVESDTYVMNEPSKATLFKRRSAANAIKRLLGKRITIIGCRVDSRGRLIKSSITVPVSRRKPKKRGAA